jgi:uncharacterized phiE125 gp8 family phage protein
MGLRALPSAEPASEPVPLDTARAHLRVEHAEEDELIQGYVSAARSYAESYMGRALLAGLWELTMDAFPRAGKAIRIPRPPLIEVEEVAYASASSGWVVLAPGAYEWGGDDDLGWVVPVDGRWPTARSVPGAVRVRFRCGYPDPAFIPREVTQAILFTVAHFYANRESVVTGTIATEVPVTTHTLLDLHRIVEAS